MTEGQKTALLVGGGIAGLFLLMNSKPRVAVPANTGLATGTGGTAVAMAGIGAGVSIIDSLTNAIAGQQTDYGSSSAGPGYTNVNYGF